jgi:hypothetical protein
VLRSDFALASIAIRWVRLRCGRSSAGHDEARSRDDLPMSARGFDLELRGGPLAGGSARVHDTEVRLAVVQKDGRLQMRDEREPPIRGAADARVIGAYGFSHREEALVWFPAVRRAP